MFERLFGKNNEVDEPEGDSGSTQERPPRERSFSQKLGKAATFRSFDSLKANGEHTYKQNIETMKEYLKSVNISPEHAEILIDSGAFDLGYLNQSELLLRVDEDDKGEPYIKSSGKDDLTHKAINYGHDYKVFSNNGKLFVFDSEVVDENRLHPSDETSEPFYNNQNPTPYRVTINRLMSIDEATGKVVDKVEYKDDRMMFGESAEKAAINVHDISEDNLDEVINEFGIDA